jgi:hypothetical protein
MSGVRNAQETGKIKPFPGLEIILGGSGQKNDKESIWEGAGSWTPKKERSIDLKSG